MAALAATHTDLRTKSRDLVRRNAWAQAGVEALVANVVGTGIKPQCLSPPERSKASVQALWRDWCEEADAVGLTDFYGLQALTRPATLEGGECLIRLRPRRPGRRPTPPCAPKPALPPSAPCCGALFWERCGTSGCCAAESRVSVITTRSKHDSTPEISP